MSAKLARPLALCLVLTIPALFLRLSGVHVAAPLSLVTFGAAVVAASFLLAVSASRHGLLLAFWLKATL